MNIRPATAQFIKELEVASDRKLHYPQEIAQLIDLAHEGGKVEVLEDVVFHAKFLTKSFGVMKRIGMDGEGYDKLSAEFQTGMEKVTTLLKTIIKESPAEIKNYFVGMFFSLSHENLANLMKLLVDLAMIKNWMLDGKPLP
ncbi:MAG: hypothetical protein HY088_08260 [Ignavibacteriales bacterium]|nr:hypothetical protein [Ignavibacteriales bacterium]